MSDTLNDTVMQWRRHTRCVGCIRTKDATFKIFSLIDNRMGINRLFDNRNSGALGFSHNVPFWVGVSNSLRRW